MQSPKRYISFNKVMEMLNTVTKANRKANSCLKVFNLAKDEVHWSCIQNGVQLESLMRNYEQNGDSPEVARIKAEKCFASNIYRKELIKVFLEHLQWMDAMQKDPTFSK